MSEELYGELFGDNDTTTEKILETMLKSDDDLSMKTEIITPVEISLLEAITAILRAENLITLADFIDKFLIKYKENMVSFKRQSRNETTKVLTARMEDKNTTRDITKKLMGTN